MRFAVAVVAAAGLVDCLDNNRLKSLLGFVLLLAFLFVHCSMAHLMLLYLLKDI
jgi:hypothetical protein